MMNGEYAFFTNEVTLESRYGEGSWMGADGRDEDAIKAFTGKVKLEPQHNNIQIMNVYECNGTNIFMR